MSDGSVFDVLIVGGGPAGLSAALVLGRCCRKVLVVDAGNPRNIRSHGVHGFISREGCAPAELLMITRQQLAAYPVAVKEGTVMTVKREENAFVATLLDGATARSRKILLATGVVDKLPSWDGIEQFYGTSVHHCPYCDGWEHRDGRLAVHGRGRAGTALSLLMKTWTRDIVLCTDGPSRLHSREREELKHNGIDVYEKKIARLEGTLGRLERVVFEDGTSLQRSGLFFSTGNVQRSTLPREIGCTLTPKGAVRAGRDQRSSCPGIFVAGDAAEDSHYVIVAAAEGAKAAMHINAELSQEDRDATQR
ncbi:MAG TPA: NAD(P)/FAD-dependent oxidoreductase [Bryobacteraceae bacterium]|nr:NAD(P)/FAD-dependent oxidoreductase [Bryobacteraceae bacterium]